MIRHSREASFILAGDRPRPAGSLGELAVQAARRGGQRPFVTFYGDATGERTELGHATLHNWVSKTANLLAGDLGLVPGTTLAVRLPTHWTTLVILLAAWRAGARVTLGGVAGAGDSAPDADAAAVGEDALATASDAARTLVVGSGLGGRLTGDAGAALAFAEEVLACPDEFDDPPVEASAPALAVAGRSASHGDLLDLATAASEALGLSAGTRLLTMLPLDAPAGLLPPLGALAADASVVLVTGDDHAVQRERAARERCDVVVTPDGAGAPPPSARGAPRWLRLALDWDEDHRAGVRTDPGTVAG